MKSIATLITLLSLLAPQASAFSTTAHRAAFSRALLQQYASSEDVVVLYSDDDDDANDNDDANEESDSNTKTTEVSFAKNKRWSSLSPAVKARIVSEGQQRAIQNKKKREPAGDKKRRMMMHYKKAMVESKRQSRIMRPLPTNSPNRTQLVDIVTGEQTYNGTIISLTNFGAYVDIGTECDGLLHVSQITRDEFVEHPRQVLKPGDIVEDVRVLRVAPELKKMQLTMLPRHVTEEEDEDEEEFEERIALKDLATDDELWGEIKRVTHFGSYVELGAVVQGWLHFMDHPEFVHGTKPRDIMKVGDRIRCWVSNVDSDMGRIKLTANRPKDLPGPRREIRKVVDDEYY
mmetsp:Transcript_3775/g.5674  ORF Transcript_3775/g.5674 Transcript_3775/m.5674 type:complete len:346 (+) Transcript_3775:79-1116(+)